MRITKLHPGTDHEPVLQAEDERAGYRAIIAIHRAAAADRLAEGRLRSA